MSLKLFFVSVAALVSVGAFTACQKAETPVMTANGEAPATSPSSKAKPVAKTSDDVYDGIPITRSEDEWRSMLSEEQYHILREEGTERAFSGELDKNKEKGFYHCGACHLKLFDSATKFDSGTGWPSFYQPINAKNVTEKTDTKYGTKRVEIECARCGSHLGHVFDDGPEPTGLRYCMNSAALKFEKGS